MPEPVVIVGGGITGLSAAWALNEQRRAVVLIEPGPLGGLMRTERVVEAGGEFVVECGADAWIRSKPWLRELAVDLGLEGDLLPCNERLRETFIFRSGKLVPLPRGLRMIAPAEWWPVLKSPLLSARTKWSMIRELRRKPVRHPDRSIADFVRDHFGNEALEYLAEPLFAGIYGAAPESLGIAGVLPTMLEHERTYGSVIRGVRREPKPTGPLFESMRGGLGQIPWALGAQLRETRFVRARAEAIEGGRVRAGGEWIDASHIILACGALPAARILSGMSAGELLGSIPHSSATIFAFGFDSAGIAGAARGFGFLVPRRERRSIMAATWSTNKFTCRSPAGYFLLRCFVAGDHSEQAIPDVLADLRRLAKVSAQPLWSRVYRWPDSLPQYEIGHARKLEQIESALPPNLHLAGAFLRGVGMPDCAKCGIHAARMIPHS